jgi:hypothetical protein
MCESLNVCVYMCVYAWMAGRCGCGKYEAANDSLHAALSLVEKHQHKGKREKQLQVIQPKKKDLTREFT